MIKLRMNRATVKLLKNITEMYQEEIDNPSTESERRIDLLNKIKTFNDLNDERKSYLGAIFEESSVNTELRGDSSRK